MKSDHSSLFRTHSDIQLLCIFNVKLESITFTSVEVKKPRIFINLRLFFFLFYGTRIIISIQQIVLGICLWNDTDTFLFFSQDYMQLYFILFYLSTRGLQCPQIVCTHHFSAGNSKTK